MKHKYDASGSIEGRFEPGSNNTVLANRLGISDIDEITKIEFQRLLVTQQRILDQVEYEETITCKHLCDWHKDWLGDIYLWAGNYRSVNLSKDGFHFAVAHVVHGLMKKFEKDYLSTLTPLKYIDEQQVIEALATTHVEFILIHPFRDGNGRLGRLLMTVMALQAGLPILDFEEIDKNKSRYFAAIQMGMAGNYHPMIGLLTSVLESSS